MAPKKTTTPMTDVAIKGLIAQGVADALAEYEATRNSRNGDDSHESGSGGRRTERATRECTYSDFLKCQPLNFNGTDGVVGLTQWFKKMEYCSDVVEFPRQDWLALMCGRMFPEESDEVEKYVGGLPDMIQGSVMASKPKTMQDAVEFTNDLMDQKIRTFADRQAENKRKLDDNSRNNQTQQQPHKRQNVARAYTAGPREKRECRGSLPLCTKCNYHHNGQYAPKVQGHYKKDCPKLKNQNRRNQAGNGGAQAKAYAVGNTGKTSDVNVVTGFVSAAFSSLIDIVPTALDHDYDVKLDNGKINKVNTIIWGCTLNFLNHPFNIDLIPIELGSFDVIIGMD
ncbi:hypothetical protein Tco_0870577 [Tanacetum coccineum]